MESSDIAKKIMEALVPTWKPAPAGSKCTQCGSEDVQRSHIFMGGPFSGSVKCNACGFTESVMSHIGKTCIEVRPMTEEEILEAKMREALE